MRKYEDLTGHKKNRVDRRHDAIRRIVKRLCYTETWGFNDKQPIPVSGNFIRSHMRSINKLFEQIEIIIRHERNVQFSTFDNKYTLT